MIATTDWNEDKASRAADFFDQCLVHSIGEWAGRPFRLEPWQRDFVRELFGRVKPDGRRRYREAYVEVPRKNGKSTLCAGLALYCLLADGEPGAQVFSAAADREQARIVFAQAKSMIESSPLLSERCRVYKNAIEVPTTTSFYRVLSSDAGTKHGLNPSAVVFDELHAQPNRELWDVLKTGFGARRQPLLVAITTAGWDKLSICWEQHDYATKVRDGLIDDPTFLPLIFAADNDDDWKQEATWRKANPSYGVTVKPEYFASEVRQAIEAPAKENTFRRLHLNQWTEQDVRWLSMDSWDAGGEPFDVAALDGKECYAGMDLSSTRDLSAVVLVFPKAINGRHAVLPFFWAPLERAKIREHRDRAPYLLWNSQGLLDLTPGESIDYAYIRSKINELGKRYKIKEIAFDPWNATQLSHQLAHEDGFDLVEFRQGMISLSAPTKELERMVINRELAHGGNEVLRWMASNVVVESDASGNYRASKKKSSEKIDGIVALIMCVGRMAAGVEKPKLLQSWVMS